MPGSLYENVDHAKGRCGYLVFRRQLKTTGDTDLGMHVNNFLDGLEPETLPYHRVIDRILRRSNRLLCEQTQICKQGPDSPLYSLDSAIRTSASRWFSAVSDFVIRQERSDFSSKRKAFCSSVPGGASSTVRSLNSVNRVTLSTRSRTPSTSLLN